MNFYTNYSIFILSSEYIYFLFLGNHGSKKICLIAVALFTIALFIHFAIYLRIGWSEVVKCAEVFQRPYEQHKIRITPKKHVFPFYELELNDLKKLIDLRNFTFINNNRFACTKPDVFLLVLIPSAPKNADKRDTIRKTWGERKDSIQILFMLGLSEDEITEKAIAKESERFADIVQGNFLDSYKNITYKSVMCLKYVIYYCPQATYILKVDDDSFVNMPLLQNFLKHDLSPYGAENLLLCNDMTGSPVLRDPNSKWYIPKEDFSSEYYPSYCSGWYAIFSPDVCFKLYRESQNLKYLFIEDAFLYGIAGAKANIKHTDISYFTIAFRNRDLLLNGTYDDLPILFGAPNMSPESIQKFYEYFKNKPVPQSIHQKIG